MHGSDKNNNGFIELMLRNIESPFIIPYNPVHGINEILT